MAKKTVDKTVSAGQGKKWCQNPDCDQIVAARSMTCKTCGFEFTPKTKPAKKSVSRQSVDTDALAALVKTAGGIDKLGKLIEELEEAGGADAVLEAVDNYLEMKKILG